VKSGVLAGALVGADDVVVSHVATITAAVPREEQRLPIMVCLHLISI
jgi:hypothetical protein